MHGNSNIKKRKIFLPFTESSGPVPRST